jgi:hypothetical protein
MGRVVLGYGPGDPVADHIVQIDCGTDADGETLWCLGRTQQDGSFSVSGVPQGSHRGAIRYIQFTVRIARAGEVVDLGTLEFPLIHPPLLSVSPGSGPPGTIVTLTGLRGLWLPGTELTVAVARPPEPPTGEYARATVPEDGSFSVSFPFPAEGSPYQAPGMVVFVVEVVTPPPGWEIDLGKLPEARATYVVTSASTPTIGFDPAEVAAGVGTTVLIRSLPENVVSGRETVCVGLRRPDNGQSVNLGQVPPGSADVDISATIPPDLPAGVYPAVLASCDFAIDSGMGEGATLTVRRGVPSG